MNWFKSFSQHTIIFLLVFFASNFQPIFRFFIELISKTQNNIRILIYNFYLRWTNFFREKKTADETTIALCKLSRCVYSVELNYQIFNMFNIDGKVNGLPWQRIYKINKTIAITCWRCAEYTNIVLHSAWFFHISNSNWTRLLLILCNFSVTTVHNT